MKSLSVLLLLMLVLIIFITSVPVQTTLLSWVFPGESRYVHARRALVDMALEHLLITVVATALSSMVGIMAGIAVTRSKGREFKELVVKLNSFVQTFPPSAVIILAFPVLGFGLKPRCSPCSCIPSFLSSQYHRGFETVSPAINDAARGMGMTWFQQLWIAQLPSAFR